jgi:hypothetical protein
MNTRLLARRWFAAGLLATVLAGASCLSRLDSEEARPEAVGSVEQADVSLQVSGPYPYPGLDSMCASVSDLAFHNPEWPWHANGACGESFTFQDALSTCGGAVRYFFYYCGDFGVEHAWTAYLGCCAPCSNGTGINLETRPFAPGTGPSNTDEARLIFYDLPVGAPGYGFNNTLTSTASFSNHTSIPGGTSQNIAYHLKASIVVDAADAGHWGFRLGADFGYGGALLVDGVQVDARWFPGNQGDGLHPDPGGSCGDTTDSSQLLQGSATLGSGTHDVEVYGFENGYDCLYSPEQMRLEYLSPSSGWAPISTSALQLCGR